MVCDIQFDACKSSRIIYLLATMMYDAVMLVFINADILAMC